METTTSWNLSTRLAFRFCFVFILLFILIVNNGAYPLWELVMAYPTDWLHLFIPWFGKNVLHLSYDITVFTNGSGDTTYDYVLLLVIAITALIGTMVWSFADRHQKEYKKLYYWLTVAIRFYVGLMLISYGLVKVIKLQFPSPGLFRLAEPYGDSSPMGLAWTFLGFSEGYNLMMGIVEVAAVLLCFRRTMTAGALLTLMATANVMAINYFYDVPVKIVSTALFTLTLFLLLHDMRKLLSFFFSNGPVSLTVIEAPVFRQKWLRISRVVLKTTIIGFSLGYGCYQVLQARNEYGDHAPKPQFYGLYHVETFVVGSDTLLPLTTDTVRWKQMSIEFEGSARVQLMNDSVIRFTTRIDTVAKTFQFTPGEDTTKNYNFKYEISDRRLSLIGQGSTQSNVGLLRKNMKNTRLMGRGFHWINEYPFNR